MSLVNKIQFDVGGAAAAIDSLDQVLSNYNQTIDNLASATRTLDKNQETNSVTLRFINEQGKQLSATFTKINGVFQRVALSQKALNEEQRAADAEMKKAISNGIKHAKAIEAQIKAIDKMQQKIREAAAATTQFDKAQAAIDRVTRPVQGNINAASPQQALQLNTAIDRIRQNIAKGKFSVYEFEQAFQNLQRNGAASLVNLDKNLAQSVGQFDRALRQAGQTGENSGRQIILTWTGVARIFLVQQIHRFVSLLSNSFVQATKSSIDFSIKIAELQTLSLRSGVTFEQWTNQVRQLSDAFGQNNASVAEGAYEGLSNQVITATNNLEFMQNALKLANATTSSTEVAVNVMSSAINSFGLATTDSARIAGVFFRTVDLGRIRLSELANTFGTLGPLAQRLGVTFEETNAIYSSLTRNGVQLNEVETQLSGILNELIKPSKEMQQLFQRLGVSSGEALIKTYGFAGTLRLMAKEAEQGVGHLGGLFNNVRALRGIIGTTGQGITDFDNDLKTLTTGSAQDLSDAFQKIADTDARKLQIEFNKLKNFFEVDLGIAFQKTLVDTIKNFGGLTQIVKEATASVATLVTAYTAFKVAQGLNNLGLLQYINNLRFQISLSGQAVTLTNLFSTSLTSLARSLSISNILIGGFTAIVGLYANSFINAKLRVAELGQELATFNQQVDANTQKLVEAERVVRNQTYKEVQAGLQQKQRAYARYVADIVALSLNVVNAVKDASNKAAEAFENYVDLIGEKIKKSANEAKNEVERLERIVENANKAKSDIQNEIIKGQVDRNVNAAATPEGKAVELQKAIDEATKRYNDLVDAGAVNTVAELEVLRKIAEEKQALEERLYEIRLQNEQNLSKEEAKLREKVAIEAAQTNEKQTRQLEARYKALLALGKGRGIDGLGIADQQRARALQKQIDDQKKAQKALDDNVKAQQNLIGARQKAEDAIRATAETRLKIEERIAKIAQEAADKQRIEAEKKALLSKNFDTAAQNFVNFNKDGKATDFTTAQTDPAAIRADFDSQQAAFDKQLELQKQELIQAAVDAGVKGNELIALQKNIEERITQIKAEASAKRLQAEAKALQEQILQQQQAAEKQYADAKANADKAAGAEIEAKSNILKVIKDLQTQIEQYRLTQGSNLAPDAQANLTDAEKSVARLIAYVTDLDKKNLLVGKNLDVVYQQYLIIFKKLNDVNQGSGFSDLLGSGVSEEQRKKFLEAANAIVTALQQIRDTRVANAERQKELTSLAASLKAVSAAYEEVTGKSKDAGETAEIKIKTTLQLINELIPRYRELAAAIQAAATANNVPFKTHGGVMQYYAQGGRGLDTQPAMLTPGEMVINRNDSMRHYHQLVAINQGRQPRNFAQGGNVTTVGDINITVQGGDSASSTVRAIGQQLKREIRLGKYKF